MKQFYAACSTQSDWQQAVEDLLGQLGALPAELNFAFIYVTDQHAVNLSRILDALKRKTQLQHWVGSVGAGICYSGHEIYEQPAIAVMLGSFAEDSFSIFNGAKNIPQYTQDEFSLHTAIVHGDPRNGLLPQYINDLPEQLGNGYLIGGLTSSESHFYQVADALTEGDLSGVIFNQQVSILSGLTQGCTPIGEVHTLTDCDHHLAITIDHQPALEVFKQEIGDVLARDIDRAAGYIFAGFPVEGSDTGDYLVRNIIGLDEKNGLLAIGDHMQSDVPIMFCKRDGQSAIQDMYRMLNNLKKRIGNKTIKGALYISCLGRGRNLFGTNSEELKMIEEVLGDIPLVGFYANGEIAGNRLYGYTGVLTLFI